VFCKFKSYLIMSIHQTIHPVTPQLGEGIYLTTDVAYILNLPYQNVYRLMRGFWHAYTFGTEKNKAVNFYALIEFYIYFQCRQGGMSAQKIKKYHEQFKEDLNTPYPFAHFEIRTDFRNMWARESENLIKADGKHQYDLLPLLNNFLHRVSYGENNLAAKYFPLETSKNIVVDPKHQFGEPVVIGTNIKTKSIYSLHVGGESNKRISNLYDIPMSKVRDAIRLHTTAA
jgi:uncharacterized protein (DUF433 family)